MFVLILLLIAGMKSIAKINLYIYLLTYSLKVKILTNVAPPMCVLSFHPLSC